MYSLHQGIVGLHWQRTGTAVTTDTRDRGVKHVFLAAS